MTIDKNIVTSMAEKYRLAEKLVFAKLQNWQKQAITEDRKTGHESSLLQQFCKDVIRMAENMEVAPPDVIPPKATTKHGVKVEPFSDGKNYDVPPWHNKNGANGNESDEESLI